jgi:hypothetical protein
LGGTMPPGLSLDLFQSTPAPKANRYRPTR